MNQHLYIFLFVTTMMSYKMMQSKTTVSYFAGFLYAMIQCNISNQLLKGLKKQVCTMALIYAFWLGNVIRSDFFKNFDSGIATAFLFSVYVQVQVIDRTNKERAEFFNISKSIHFKEQNLK